MPIRYPAALICEAASPWALRKLELEAAATAALAWNSSWGNRKKKGGCQQFVSEQNKGTGGGYCCICLELLLGKLKNRRKKRGEGGGVARAFVWNSSLGNRKIEGKKGVSTICE